MLGKLLVKGAIINIDYGTNREVGEREYAAIWHFGSKANRKKMIEDLGDLPEDQTHRNLLWGYYNPGNVDITAHVNFAPLIAQAQKDNLNVAYAGLQRDLLLRVGAPELAEQYYGELKSTTSWDTYWTLWRALDGFPGTLDVEASNPSSMGFYYSTVLTKGIDSEELQQFKKITGEEKDNTSIFLPKIEINVGEPNTDITVRIGEKSDNMSTDSRGFFRVKPEIDKMKPGIFIKAVINYKNGDGFYL